MRVTVVGAGSWGTTIASLAAERNETVIWARSEEVAADIELAHRNEVYLPGLELYRSLRATTDLASALREADLLVLATPSHALRDALMAMAPFVPAAIPVISLIKGLEPGTGRRMSQVVAEVLPGHPAGVITGPNIAAEVMGGYAAAAVVAFSDIETAIAVQGALRTPLFRLYTSDDVVGAELGGAYKNVYAIAAGMAEGLDAGDNTRAAVLARSLREMVLLGVCEGGASDTFAGLAGLGDLLATSMSPSSRNRRLGEALAAGRSTSEATRGRMVVEGVRTAPVILAMAAVHGLSLPIAEEVAAVLRGERTARQAFRGLLRNTPTSELVAG